MDRNVTTAALLVVSALAASAPLARGTRITAVEVEGTQFRVVLDDGRVLDSAALAGALLDVALPNGAKQRIRILEVTPDPKDPDGEIILHRIATVDAVGHESEPCQPDPQGARWVFPLRGQWNNEGKRTSGTGFTLTCSDGAQGKCVRFGYKPWKTRPDGVALATFHAACIKAVRADYCGDHATTRDGERTRPRALITTWTRGRRRRSPRMALAPRGGSCAAPWGRSTSRRPRRERCCRRRRSRRVCPSAHR